MDKESDGIRASRLGAAEYAANFSDSHVPLNRVQALIEADRCYYCYDAPCIQACPTGIDIPTFIQRIAQDNLRGAAKAILEENILGGMCARVCPTEVLCEQACVRNTNEDKPVEIGLLQRFATDGYFAKPGAPLFSRAQRSGRRFAAVGAGPAGLSFAHRIAMLGHDVVVFDAHPKAGGLNEYGLATYKTVDGFAQKEIEWLLSIGGIELRNGETLEWWTDFERTFASFARRSPRDARVRRLGSAIQERRGGVPVAGPPAGRGRRRRHVPADLPGLRCGGRRGRPCRRSRGRCQQPGQGRHPRP